MEDLAITVAELRIAVPAPRTRKAGRPGSRRKRGQDAGAR